MSNKIRLTIYCLLIGSLSSSLAKAQTSPVAVPSILNNYPWTESELLEPAFLAANLKQAPAKWPLVLNIGAVEDIKGAKHIGAVSEDKNIKALKSSVAALSKNTMVIIYCGCCPFTKCPNIKPAFLNLKKWGLQTLNC